MKSHLAIGVGFILVAAAAGVARAASVSANLEYTVSVTGTWASEDVQNGPPYLYAVSQVGGVPAFGFPIGNTASTANALAQYTVSASADETTGAPQFGVLASAWGINAGDAGNAYAITTTALGLTKDSSLETVTVTIGYRYTLDGTDAATDWLAGIELDLQVYSPGGTALLGTASHPDWSTGHFFPFGPEGSLALFDSLAGGPAVSPSTNIGWAYETWQFDAAAYGSYSLQVAAIAGINEARPAAVPEPVTMLSAILAISSLGLYMRRRLRPMAGH